MAPTITNACQSGPSHTPTLVTSSADNGREWPVTSHVTHSGAHKAPSFQISDEPSTRVTAIDTPGTDLLTRAHAGWQRFLDTFQGAPDE